MRSGIALVLLLAACGGSATTTEPSSSRTTPTEPTTSAPVLTTSPTRVPSTTAVERWQRLDRLGFPRSEMPAVTIDGLVYVPGGFMETSQGPRGQSVVERYHPVSGEWVRVADMPAARHHLMAVAHDGFMYVFGGFSDRGIETTTWRYDPSADAWTGRAPLPGPVAAGGAAVLGDLIYVVGGVPDGTSVYSYDPAADTWSVERPLDTAREHSAAVAHRGRVYAIAGRWEGRSLTSVESFDPVAGRWSRGPDLSEERSGFGATVWNGVIVVGGGEDLVTFATSSSLEILDSGGSWVTIEPLPVALHGFALAAIDDLLYSVGGSRRAGSVSNSGDFFVRGP